MKSENNSMMSQMISKASIIYFIGLLALSSCIDLGFTEVQPTQGRNIEKLPESVTGTYINKEDTLHITTERVISGKDTTWIISSDEFKIREWRDLYFLNTKEPEQNYWTVAVLKINDTSIDLYLPEVAEEDLDKLRKKYEVKVLYNEENKPRAFIIDPSPQNWKKLLKSGFYQKESFKRLK